MATLKKILVWLSHHLQLVLGAATSLALMLFLRPSRAPQMAPAESKSLQTEAELQAHLDAEEAAYHAVKAAGPAHNLPAAEAYLKANGRLK